MESTKSFLKQFEDREHLSEIDKKIERNKPAFRGPPIWITRRDEEIVPATFEDLETAVREKMEAMAEEVEERPKRLKLLWEIWAVLKQLWTFDREVQGK